MLSEINLFPATQSVAQRRANPAHFLSFTKASVCGSHPVNLLLTFPIFSGPELGEQHPGGQHDDGHERDGQLPEEDLPRV